ncbi:extracellular solute-binding protein [Streptomyces sp. DSM 44917]|uniref:Extracellular solute-binding protein n=1 Tax=Streptomyces boetiae TaxID=3075541 RepID=A0ABU2LBS0_9ACTN|nr:extracellular solute-binding protein [Streptomyces sp. DSM 44917]MDT0309033.1 extracellular solute-binding protein [Streptomyces sp. DSM 44917]
MRGRRAALAVALTAAVAVLAGAAVWLVRSAAPERGVTVLASWTGDDAAAFAELTDAFTAETGIAVNYQGTTALREVLLSQVQSGSPPDIAILPSLGQLAEYVERGLAFPLDGAFDERGEAELRAAYGAPWLSPEGLGEPGSIYWFPVKADLKSLVWYDRSRPSADPADGESWCLGMGSDATSGWPGTDWIEDLLLQAPGGLDVYEAWATGDHARWTSPEMRAAWRAFGELVTGNGSGRAVESLTTDYFVASAGLAPDAGPGAQSCALDHRESNARSAYGAADIAYSPSAEVFPGTAGAPNAWEVGGDFAALFRQDPDAEALMAFLASEEAQEIWVREASGDASTPLSAHAGAEAFTGDTDPLTAALTGHLRGAETPRCLDASDTMPPALREAFHLEVLTFLADVPAHLDDPTLLDALLQRLRATGESTAAAHATWLTSTCGPPPR